MTVNTHPEGISLDEHVVLEPRESIAELYRSINDLTEIERFLLRRWFEGAPISDQLVLGGPGGRFEQTLIGPGAEERFQGVAVFNYGSSPVSIGFSAGAAVGSGFRCPPETLLVLPINYQDVSLGVSASALATAVTVCRLRIAPLSPQAFPLNGGIEEGGLTDTVMAAGATAAAPAAGAVVASIPAAQLPAGAYAVQVTTYETTPDANAVNMTLKKGAAAIGALTSTGAVTTVTRERVTLDGASALQVVVGAAAGGAGAIYIASIAATQIA
jgi:hypothetical protein